MAILEHETVQSTTGFAKEIDEAAITMIFDNLQRHQYIKPIQSTVREIACNALDSVKERDAAIEIITGRKEEKDYFLRRDEAIYKDSNFDPSYYNLKYLSNKKDILITYHSNGTTGDKDFISFKDWGVGLGGKRLQNSIQKLGWSTKRNTILAIGKFGIGAKAPLSTGVASFRTISVYNGKRYIIDVFSHKYESVVPKFDLDKSITNKFDVWEGRDTNGLPHTENIYYEDVPEKNSVEIIVMTKKHHKQQYIDAVKSQLLYLQGIKFVVLEDDYEQVIDVTPKVLYEDDKIILADNHQYSKPHIVIDKVNYGYVDFPELELEAKLGNIGIKVAAHEVSVNPSRESVIWNEQTRTTIVNRFKEVVSIATKFIESSLDEKSFIPWLQKCMSTLAATDRSSVLGRLSQIINKEDISPSFPGDPTIKFNTLNNFFRGFKTRFISEEYDGKKGRDFIKRRDATTWASVTFDQIYLQEGATSHVKDLYLYTLANSGNHSYNKIKILIVEPIPLDLTTTLTKAQKKQYKEAQTALITQLKKGLDYDKVIIPDDWKDRLKKLEEGEESEEEADKIVLSKADLRKLNAKTVYTCPVGTGGWDNAVVFRTFEWKITEIKDIVYSKGLTNIIYGFQDDRGLLTFLHEYTKSNDLKNKFKIISIAKQNERLYSVQKDIVYVKDIFQQVDPKKQIITVNDLIKIYNTVRLLSKDMHKLNFMNNYESIDVDIFELFKEVQKYMMNNRIDSLRHDAKDEIDKYLDKVIEFQLFVAGANGNIKLISDKSLQLFSTKEFKDASVIDVDIYEKYKKLLSYADPIYTLLNEIERLTSIMDMSSELELEIIQYVNHKLNLQ